MPLYTVILDYSGGTYIDQVRAVSTRAACVEWAKRADAKSIYGLGKKSLEVLRAEMRDSLIHSLDGIENVWCTTVLLNNKLALINISKTKTSVDRK